MGSFIPPLPQPPHVQGPSQAAPGGNIAGFPPASLGGGALPYQQPLAPQMLSGINAFIQNYQASRDAERQRHRDEFQTDLTNLMAGFTPDLKKMARSAKKAGMNIDFESTASQPPAPAMPTPQLPTQNSPLNSADTANLQQSLNVPSLPGNPGAPAPPQGMGQRLMSAMGAGTPQINPQSPGMLQLQNMVQQAQQKQQLQQGNVGIQQMLQGVQKMNLTNEAQKQLIYQGALRDDPKAMEMAFRTDQMKPLPFDEFMSTARNMGVPEDMAQQQYWHMITGGPKMTEMQWNAAEKMKDNFGGDIMKAFNYVKDPQNSPFKPSGLTAQQEMDLTKQALELKDKYVNLDPGSAKKIVLLSTFGGAAGQDAATKLMARLESVNGVKDKSATEQYWKGMDYNVAMGHLNEDIRSHNMEHEMSVQKGVESAMGENLGNLQKVISDPQSSPADVAIAKQAWASQISKMGGVKVKLPDGTTTTLGPDNITAERVASWREPWSALWGQHHYQLGLKPVLGQGSPEQALSDTQQLMQPPPYLSPEERGSWDKTLKDRLGKRMIQLNLGNIAAPNAQVPGAAGNAYDYQKAMQKLVEELKP